MVDVDLDGGGGERGELVPRPYDLLLVAVGMLLVGGGVLLAFGAGAAMIVTGVMLITASLF